MSDMRDTGGFTPDSLLSAQQGYPQGNPQGYPQGNPQGYPQGNPQGYPQGNPQGYPQGNPQGYLFASEPSQELGGYSPNLSPILDAYLYPDRDSKLSASKVGIPRDEIGDSSASVPLLDQAYTIRLEGSKSTGSLPKKAKKKKKKVGFLHLIDTLLSVREGRKSSSESLRTYGEGFAIDMGGFYYSKDKISFLYVFDDFPREFSVSYRDDIRSFASTGVQVHFFTHCDRYNIPWSSPELKSKMLAWHDLKKQRDADPVSEFTLRDNVGKMQRQQWLSESLVYLNTAELLDKRKIFKTKFVMSISGVRGDSFDKSVRDIEIYCANSGYSLRRVSYEVDSYLKLLSPFKLMYDKRTDDSISKFVLTDEILARLPTFTQGAVGAEGCYFGTDIFSGFPVLKKVKRRATDAEIWLITAETGGGKSNLIKLLAYQLLGLGVYGTILDVEGKEYAPMADFVARNSQVETVTMGGTAGSLGKYFDPVEIFTDLAVGQLDSEAKKLATDFTISILKVLLGPAYACNVCMETVVVDAVSLTYRNVGVTDEPDTWVFSKGLTLHSVFNTLCTALPTYRDSEDYKQAVSVASVVLEKYFASDGARADLFKERVNILDVISADLLICSFGMEGKSASAVSPEQMALMQLSAANIAYQRTVFAKARGKYNFKIWEEFQRWGDFPDSDKTIGVAVTGGRKAGNIDIIATNEVGKLLTGGGFGIFQNKSSVMIGAIDDAAIRKELCDRLSLPEMLSELDTIARESRLAKDTNIVTPYRYSFLMVLDGKATVAKVDLPEYIQESELFATGVSESKASVSDDALQDMQLDESAMLLDESEFIDFTG